MALRLTGTTPSASAKPATASLDDVARKLLDSGDLSGYRKLFAKAAAVEDVHERYRQRRTLVEAAQEAGATIDSGRLPALYLAVLRELLTLLDEEPREPRMLNYAGVFFYELWALRPARALFDAAYRLDPQVPNLSRNRRELKRREQAGQAARLPKAVSVALAELGRRAERIAARAQPARGLTLSLCMIVKDEEEMLPRCLATAAGAFDEIVVVDTGSSDRTIEIAKSFGAKVLEREWTGSFSDARNASFDAATGDWLMYLDADEVLVEEDIARLRAATGQVWRESFFVNEISYTGRIGDGTATHHVALRIFRNRPEYRFSGRLHEQITDKLPEGMPERNGTLDVRVEHFGYLGAVREQKEKWRRNIDLLLAQREDGDVDGDPFFHFNLGSEYFALGHLESAHEEFEAAWELLNTGDRPPAGYASSLLVRSVNVLIARDKYEEAIARAQEGLDRVPDFTDLVYQQGVALDRLGRTDEALEHFRRCIAMGDAPSRHTATVGMGTFLPAMAIAEITHHRLGDPAGAAAMLDQVVSEHPGFYGLVMPFAAAMLAAGSEPEAVVARVSELVEELTPTVRFMLGNALYEAGHTALAEVQYRALLDRQPDNGGARVALAESLLSQKRYAEAVVEAAALEDDAPFAESARRSELFARIVDNDLDGAAAVLARPASGGVAPEDAALFGAWLAAARGSTAAAMLPFDSVPRLAVMLEALLRVEEFQAFEQLVALLGRTPIPEREQRELLASMYLRRGFLASAVEEWMAVAQDDPTDVRALVGLAQAAAANGMNEEALDFAREARSLEPEHKTAAALIEHLEPLAA